MRDRVAALRGQSLSTLGYGPAPVVELARDAYVASVHRGEGTAVIAVLVRVDDDGMGLSTHPIVGQLVITGSDDATLVAGFLPQEATTVQVRESKSLLWGTEVDNGMFLVLLHDRPERVAGELLFLNGDEPVTTARLESTSAP